MDIRQSEFEQLSQVVVWCEFLPGDYGLELNQKVIDENQQEALIFMSIVEESGYLAERVGMDLGQYRVK